MNAFEVVKGYQTISGDLVRIDAIEVNRLGEVSVVPLLTNGKTVRVVHCGGNMMRLITGKGSRTLLVGRTTQAIRFTVDGVEVAVLTGDDVDLFDPVDVVAL